MSSLEANMPTNSGGGGRRTLGVGLAIATVAAIVAAATNIEAFIGLVGRILPVVSETIMAGTLSSSWSRERLATTQLEKVFLDQTLCGVSGQPIDLDGNGLKADLFVRFTAGKSDGSGCFADVPEQNEAAFFRWDSTKFVFAANPKHRVGDVAVWTFVGPTALRVLINSNTPPVEVFMLRGQQVVNVGEIDTFNLGKESWIKTKPIPNGALVLVPTGVWQILHETTTGGTITHLELKDIMPEDGHSHLLTYELGNLKLDGEIVEIVSGPLAQGDEDVEPSQSAEIRIAPLDRLYLSGCRPGEGLAEHATLFAAYTVDLAKRPYVSCRTNEDGGSGITVHIRSSSP